MVLVGHGRMAGAFAKALRASARAGGSLDLRRASRDELADPGAALRRFARDGGAICWVLAVRDAGVRACAEGLAKGGLAREPHTAVHLAGMLGPDALDALRAVGVAVGAMHPLVAVASGDDPPSLAGLAASFEGDERAWRAAKRLGALTGMSVARVEGVDRAAYHAGAALMATGAVALAQGAALAWANAAPGAGIGEPAARAFAASLLRSVAHNVAAVGASEALASPLLRGDVATVGAHFDALRATGAGPLSLYVSAVAVVLRDLAARAVLTEPQVRAVAELLRREGRADA